MSSRLGKLLCLASAVALAATLVACGGSSAGSASTGGSSASSSASASSASAASGSASQSTSVDKGTATYYQATNDDGFVNTLIGEKVGDGKVTNEEEAKECLKGAMERLGGDGSIELVIDSTVQSAGDTKVYTFTQQADGVLVQGATVKLIVDKDGSPIGIVSSIMPGVNAKPISEWAIDAAGAEKVVADQLKSTDSTATIVQGATDKVIIPDPAQGGTNTCAWVVYTFQVDAEHEDGIYAANYVSAQGAYLYSMPISGPGDPDVETGQSAKSRFDFDAYEPGETSVTVKHVDGKTEEVTVPVLKDAATGKTYLADAKRKILCADMAPYYYKDELMPTEVQDGADPIDAHEYYTFIRVWDFFDSVGWTGPDGKGTPTLLLMNFVDPAGETVDNAAYMQKADGFQVFGFTRAGDYGECVDVVGHEFVHCLTHTTMTGKVNKGDPGAINEGYSDVMGNIVETELDGDAGAWLMGEGLGPDGIMRNMAAPHEYAQPAFTFDAYYAPKPPVATGMNDKGGAHTNSSLIAILPYKLEKAGMSVDDQGYFWMNVALFMSPQTDYPMLAELLPWTMQQVGYDKYVEPLKAAIGEAKLSVNEDPGTVPDGCGSATFDFADIKEAADNGRVSLTFFEAPDANIEKRASTWPMTGATVAKTNLPAGDYYVVVQVGDESGDFKKLIALGEDGWKVLDGKDSETIKAGAKVVTVEAGKTLEISNDGFGPVATEALKAIDQALADQAGA
jgi:Zn-dependent metalloprotease